MRLMGMLRSLIFYTSAPVFWSLFAFTWLFKSGIWFFPSLKKLAEEETPDSSKLSVVILQLVGLDTIYGFFAAYFVFTIFFTATVLFTAWRSSPKNFRAAAVVFALFPASFTALFWVGPDSFVLLIIALTVLFRFRWYLVLPLSFILGMEHFEVGVFATIGLLLSSWISQSKSSVLAPVHFPWVFGLAIGLGKLASSFLNKTAILSSSKVDWWSANWPEIVGQFLLRPHVVLWGTLGVAWLVVVRLFDFPGLARTVVAGLSPSFLLLLLVEDQTRIFALTSLPVVLIYIVLNRDFLSRIGDTWVVAMAFAWIVIPVTWVWAGYPKWSVTPYNVGLILDVLFPGLDLPVTTHWPFV